MWQKRLLMLTVLCTAMSMVFADDITVTTTADENGTNTSACSLREAIELINHPLDHLDPNSKADSDANRNKTFGGCNIVNADNANIVLNPKDVYDITLPDALKINASMTIRSATLAIVDNVDFNDNPTIRITPNLKHRLFTISSNSTDPQNRLTVHIGRVNLIGCAATAGTCEIVGGIIDNTEDLTLEGLKIFNGVADQGGAVYNDKRQASSAGGTLTVTSVEFFQNKARQGAAIYSPFLSFNVARSLFRDNTTTDNNSAVVDGAELVDTPKDNATMDASVVNSTFYNNKGGYVINLVGGMRANNITVVQNAAGILMSATKTAKLGNSIVAGNGNDCVLSGTADLTHLNHVLFSQGCDAAGLQQDQVRKISNKGDELLMAGSYANNSYVAPIVYGGDDEDRSAIRCSLPPAKGLLCPMLWSTDSSIGFFKPRLLASYQRLSESPLVNKGYSSAVTSSSANLACESKDQRGKDRTLCDIGAIELVVPDPKATNGKDVMYGDRDVRIDLIDSLGDGELLDAASCAATFPSITPQVFSFWQAAATALKRVPNASNTWTPGCLRLPPQDTTTQTKGYVWIDADTNEVVYHSYNDFHGYDDTTYYLTTTTTRFADAMNDKSIEVRTRIVMSPYNSIVSKTVNLKNGSVGLFMLFALILLAGMRRYIGEV